MKTQADYLREHVLEPSDGCRIWPFSFAKGKYGSLWLDGKLQRVNRVTCLAWHGPPPTPSHDAAHTCGNSKCWAGEHLVWKTRRENLADRIEHGTDQSGSRNPKAKLTEADIPRIRLRLAAGESLVMIAADYSVHPSTIRDIRRGATWRGH